MSLQPVSQGRVLPPIDMLFGGNPTTGYTLGVTIYDINGNPVTLGGGGDASEATLQALLTELLTVANEATLAQVLTALQSTLNVSIANTSLEITNDAGNPVPVSLTVIPLAPNAATQTTLAQVLTALQSTLSVSLINTSLEIANDAGNPIPVSAPRSALTLTEAALGGSGTVAAGAVSITFQATVNAMTVNGITYPQGTVKIYEEEFGRVYPAINWSTTGAVVITETR